MPQSGSQNRLSAETQRKKTQGTTLLFLFKFASWFVWFYNTDHRQNKSKGFDTACLSPKYSNQSWNLDAHVDLSRHSVTLCICLLSTSGCHKLKEKHNWIWIWISLPLMGGGLAATKELTAAKIGCCVSFVGAKMWQLNTLQSTHVLCMHKSK